MSSALRARHGSPLTLEAASAEAVAEDDPRHGMLERIRASHSLLDLRFERGSEAFQTAIIELVPRHGYLVLDALSPDDGNAQIQRETPIRLRTRLDGLEIRFATRITRRGSDATAPYYKAPYPATIEYPQRRREHRVNVPFDRGIAMRFESDGGACWSGEVRDLSPSGFSARLTRGDIDALHGVEGARGRCTIDFGAGGENVAAVVEICHVFPRRGRSAPRIGACFVDLDARSERVIEREVARLERERARLR